MFGAPDVLRSGRSIVAVDLFAPFVTLSARTHRRNRARIQTLERDGLTRHVAIPVFPFVDPAQALSILATSLR